MKYIYYFKECCSNRAVYAFDSFEEAFEGAKKATTGDDNKIKNEIQMARKDCHNGFMIGYD